MTTVLTKAAWRLLVALSALWALNHMVGAFLFTQPRIGLWYLGAGLVMAAAQLVTIREFRGSSAVLSAGDRA